MNSRELVYFVEQSVMKCTMDPVDGAVGEHEKGEYWRDFPQPSCIPKWIQSIK